MDTTIYLGGEVPEDILELEDNTENMASSTVTTAEPVSTPVPSEVSREHNNKKLAKSQWLPRWVRKWMRGSVSVGEGLFGVEWDVNGVLLGDHQWWNGPNICVTREATNSTDDTQDETGITNHQMYTNTICDQTETSYRCTTNVGTMGHVQTFTEIYQCCHGFQRVSGEDGCPRELNLLGMLETLRENGASETVRALESLGLQELLGDGNFTMFAPTDEAFRETLSPEQALESNVVIVSPNTMNMANNMQEILLAHIVPKTRTSSRLSDEELVSTIDPGIKIRVNFYSTPRQLMTANCVPVVSQDNLAENGVVHIVNDVLWPVTDTIADIVTRDPQLSTLKTLIGQSGLLPILRNPGQRTLFAPTNTAFINLPDALRHRLLVLDTCVSNLLEEHLLPNVICSSIIEGTVRTPNVLDSFVTLSRDESGKLFVNGVQLVTRDIMATNGVVHIIDGVLVPDAALDVLSVANKIGATSFSDLVGSAGLTKAVQRMSNFTLFVPTNEAFESMSPEDMSRFNSSQMSLQQLMKYHIAQSMVSGLQLYDGRTLDTRKEGSEIRLHHYHSAPFGLQESRTAQCAPIERTDIDTCGGTIHTVSKVLIPPRGDVLDTLSQDSRFSILVDLLKTAYLSEDLQGDGPITFLAPTNQAFSHLSSTEMAGLKEDITTLRQFLKRHILLVDICCAGVFNNPWFWKQKERTMDGSLLKLENTPEGVKVGHNTAIALCDIVATNGVVHGLNKLLPTAVNRYFPKLAGRTTHRGGHRQLSRWLPDFGRMTETLGNVRSHVENLGDTFDNFGEHFERLNEHAQDLHDNFNLNQFFKWRR